MVTKEKKGLKLNFKLCNFRFFTALFIACALGVLIAFELYEYKVVDYVVAILSGTAILSVLLIFRKRSALAIIIILGFSLFYGATVGSLYDKLTDDTDYRSDYMTVRIEFVSADGERMTCSTAEGVAELSVRNSEGFEFQEGMRLTLEDVHVSSVSIVKDGEIDGYLINQSERYIVKANSVYEVKEHSPDLSESLRLGIKSATADLPIEERVIIVALLTGDKYGIDRAVYDNYKISGIAHVLAVSGLHVVFLYSAVNFLMRSLKIRKKIRVILSIPVLFLFSATCSFAPSVIRASVMLTVNSVVPAVSRRRYDSLSAMSLSALIILAFDPLDLFDYGFILSFASVFGIVTLSPVFKRLFGKLPVFLRDSLALSTSVSLATFPLLAEFFGYVSVLSAITNIVVVPVLGIFYGVLFASVLVVSLFPILSFILMPCVLVVKAISTVAGIVASIPFAVLEVSATLWFTCSYYGSGLLLSDYVFLKGEYKRAVWIIFALVILFYLVI